MNITDTTMTDGGAAEPQSTDTAAAPATPAKPARAPRKPKAAAAPPADQPPAAAQDKHTGDLLAVGDNQAAAGALATMAAPAEGLAAIGMPNMPAEKLVSLVFEPFKTKLEQYAAQASVIALTEEERDELEAQQLELPEGERKQILLLDITTKDGMALAKTWRARFRDEVRIEAEKARVLRKEPILLIGRLLDSTYKEIEGVSKPLELKFDAAIKAEEARAQREREEAEERERVRVAAIRVKIKKITDKPQELAGATAEELEQALRDLAGMAITEAEYQELHAEALLAHDATGSALYALYNGARQRELDAREAAAERERLAEQARELEQQRAQLEQQAQQSAQLLEQQQAMIRQQQHATAEIGALQGVASRDGEAIELQRVLEQILAKKITPEDFGAMLPLATMARDMAVTALQGKIAAQVAIELPALHAEALEDHAVWLDAHRQLPIPPAAAPAPTIAPTPAPTAAPTLPPAVPVTSARAGDGPAVLAFQQAARKLLETRTADEVADILAQVVIELENDYGR